MWTTPPGAWPMPCWPSSGVGTRTSSRGWRAASVACGTGPVASGGAPNGAKPCTQPAVREVGDWAKLKPLDPGQGALGRELEALRLILDGRSDDVPVFHTVFTPLTIARKLAGERLAQDLRD